MCRWGFGELDRILAYEMKDGSDIPTGKCSHTTGYWCYWYVNSASEGLKKSLS